MSINTDLIPLSPSSSALQRGNSAPNNVKALLTSRLFFNQISPLPPPAAIKAAEFCLISPLPFSSDSDVSGITPKATPDLGLSRADNALMHSMFHARSFSESLSFIEILGLEISSSLSACREILEAIKEDCPFKPEAEKIIVRVWNKFKITWGQIHISIANGSPRFVKYPEFSPDPLLLIPIEKASSVLKILQLLLKKLLSSLSIEGPQIPPKSSPASERLSRKLLLLKTKDFEENIQTLIRKLNLGIHFLDHPQGSLILKKKSLSLLYPSEIPIGSNIQKTLEELSQYLNFTNEVSESLKIQLGINLSRFIREFRDTLLQISKESHLDTLIKKTFILKADLGKKIFYLQKFSNSYALRLSNTTNGSLDPQALLRITKESTNNVVNSQNDLVSLLTAIHTFSSLVVDSWTTCYGILDEQVLAPILTDDSYITSEYYMVRLCQNLDFYLKPPDKEFLSLSEEKLLMPIKAKIRDSIHVLLEGFLEGLDQEELKTWFLKLCDHKKRTGVFNPPIWRHFIEKFVPIIERFPSFLSALKVHHQDHLNFLSTHLTFESAAKKIPLIEQLYFQESSPLIIWMLIVIDVHALLHEGNPENIYSFQGIPPECLDFISIDGIEKSIPPQRPSLLNLEPLLSLEELPKGSLAATCSQGAAAPKKTPLVANPNPLPIVNPNPIPNVDSSPQLFTIARNANPRAIKSALEAFGFHLAYCTGGHQIFQNPTGKKIVLPLGTLPIGTARSIVKQVNDL